MGHTVSAGLLSAATDLCGLEGQGSRRPLPPDPTDGEVEGECNTFVSRGTFEKHMWWQDIFIFHFLCFVTFKSFLWCTYISFKIRKKEVLNTYVNTAHLENIGLWGRDALSMPCEIDEACNPLTAVDVFLQMMGEKRGYFTQFLCRKGLWQVKALCFPLFPLASHRPTTCGSGSQEPRKKFQQRPSPVVSLRNGALRVQPAGSSVFLHLD